MTADASGSEALVRQFYDRAWNAEDLTAYDDLVTDDFVDHQAMPGLPSGREGFRQLEVLFRTAFPDVRVEVEDVVAEGDLVARGGSRPARTRGRSSGSRRPAGRSA